METLVELVSLRDPRPIRLQVADMRLRVEHAKYESVLSLSLLSRGVDIRHQDILRVSGYAYLVQSVTHASAPNGDVLTTVAAMRYDDSDSRGTPVDSVILKQMVGATDAQVRILEGMGLITDSPLPKHTSYAVLGRTPRAGDEIVVTSGEQRGWRGRVECDYPSIPTAVVARMTRLDGTSVPSPVTHRIECIGVVLAPVPEFQSEADAEAWLTANDREVRPAYVVGQRITFRWDHRVKRANEALDGVFMRVVEELRLTGRVTKFVPATSLRSAPAHYNVLTFEYPGKEGDPVIMDVDPDRIEGLAPGTT